MASPFASAGLGQFGSESQYLSGGGDGFIPGLILKATGAEDFLNKNLGVSYQGGKLAPIKPPTNNAAPVAPAAPTSEVAPMMPSNDAQSMSFPSLQNAASGIMNSASSIGHDILNAGKSFIGGLIP